jgi:transforming growth factor-beta-induced protein
MASKERRGWGDFSIILTGSQLDSLTSQTFLYRNNSLFLAYHGADAQQSCLTIADIACHTAGFTTLCAAVTAAGLADELSTGTYTVFAPTNAAFAALPAGTLDNLLDDKAALTNILLFHAVADQELMVSNLQCGALTEMANGENSRTVCQGRAKFQKGGGNARDKMPKIRSAVPACNGVLHIVNQVMLP